MIKKYFISIIFLSSIFAHSPIKDTLEESIASFKKDTYLEMNKLNQKAFNRMMHFIFFPKYRYIPQLFCADDCFVVEVHGEDAWLNKRMGRKTMYNVPLKSRADSINSAIAGMNWNQPEGPVFVQQFYLPWIIEFGRYFLLIDLQKKIKQANLIVDETKKRAALKDIESIFAEIKKDPRSLIKKSYGYNVI